MIGVAMILCEELSQSMHHHAVLAARSPQSFPGAIVMPQKSLPLKMAIKKGSALLNRTFLDLFGGGAWI